VESTTFPNNADPQLAWSIEAGSNPTWQRTGSAFASGSSSARINLRSIPAGTINSLISPPIDMSNVSDADAELTFKLAHAPRFEGSQERLRVYASKNCGVTWTLRYSKQGDQLTTNSGAFVSSTFIPTANEWREEVVNLSSMAGEEHVLIKFEAFSDQENYLYIDDINIASNANSNTGIADVDADLSISVQPNPINGNSIIALNSKNNQSVELVLVDVTGRSLGTKAIDLKVGRNQVAFAEIGVPHSHGVYLIRTRTERGTSFVKVVIE
jgi:hypothetical protein